MQVPATNHKHGNMTLFCFTVFGIKKEGGKSFVYIFPREVFESSKGNGD